MWQYCVALIPATVAFLLLSRPTQQLDKDKKRRPVLLPSTTFHSRFKPLLHSFRYPVLYIGVDLDTVGYNDTVLSFSDAWRPLKLHAGDYLGTKYTGSIKEKLWSHMHDHNVDTTQLRRSYLVTTPRVLGYSFNPVSFHYVYDTSENLAVVVLEVNNTFGEKHIYVLEQSKETRIRQGYTSAQRFPRSFHVSPFNDRSGSYELQCRDPFLSDDVKVDMHLTLLEPGGAKKLTAQVNSTHAVYTTQLSSWVTLLTHATAVFLTVPRILIEAWRLHYSKKLGVYLRPEPVEGVSGIGRQTATQRDLYFQDLVVEYIRANVEWTGCRSITFKILPSSEEIVIQGTGSDELEVIVLSHQFFSSLVTSQSPLTCLFTDSIGPTTPLFRTSSTTLFLRVMECGFKRRLPGRRYLSDLRTKYRGAPAWFEEYVKSTDYNISSSNEAFDNYVHERMSITWYRYYIHSSLLLTHLGNSLFSAIATFTGPDGGPGDEWDRVRRRVLPPSTPSDI